ncbi:MAG: hypothetical protein GY839_01960 [candidate division Zixibacteria bacterium]|nr:hypothetical protein [candidate division Zixibacteria bacterium]
MSNSKQVIVRRLDGLLSDFLKAYAIKRLDRLQIEKRIDRLREITFGGRSRYRRMENRFEALETWFSENRDLLSEHAVTGSMRNRITECVDQIGAYSRGNYDNFSMKTGLYNRKQAARIAIMANQFLNEKSVTKAEKVGEPLTEKFIRPPEIETRTESSSPARNRDINDRLMDSLTYQSKMLDYFRKTDQHPFTAVDNLLNSIENNPDIKTKHLAASVLYFLKLNDYKVAPYVERLRKLGKNENE